MHIEFDPAMHDEGYVIAPMGESGIDGPRRYPSGLFYGAQTVKQLIRGSGKDAVLLIPTIRDWPAMAHRGLSDDWSRGPLPNMEFLKREIRTLAAYKYNIFSPYFEHTFAYSSTPVAAFPGGAMTPDEARELVAYAAKYHITIIPEQEAFGHLHHVLKFEQYSPIGETPHGHVLAPGDPNTLPQIASWFGDLAKVFPGPYAHIGADETAELGLGRTRDEVKQQGLGKVYLDFLSKIHATLEPNHKRLLFWGDIAVNSPELVGTLPKDMIAVPWEYDAAPDFTKQIEPFTKAGLETWVAPGVNNWSRLYPNNNEALGNIRAFVRDGQKLGATGMINTVWNDDGEGLFDQNWFGVLFGAAAAWQPGESAEAAFTDSYGLAFHADPTGKISQAQREIMAAHALLKTAGLEDANDSLFWADPFSPQGQQIAAKIGPALHDLRLHAERAITLLAEAREAARDQHRELANTEALDALELGARRIDFVGFKFQNADGDCFALQPGAVARRRQRPPQRSRRHHVERWLGRRPPAGYARRLFAARRTVSAGVAAREPSVLAGKQPGPLRHSPRSYGSSAAKSGAWCKINGSKSTLFRRRPRPACLPPRNNHRLQSLKHSRNGCPRSRPPWRMRPGIGINTRSAPLARGSRRVHCLPQSRTHQHFRRPRLLRLSSPRPHREGPWRPR